MHLGFLMLGCMATPPFVLPKLGQDMWGMGVWFVGIILSVLIIDLLMNYFDSCWLKYRFIYSFVDLFNGLLYNLLFVYC